MRGACLIPLAAALAAAENEHDVQRQRFIDEINARQTLWKAGHNLQFRGMPVGASKDLCGGKSDQEELLAAAVSRGEIKVREHSGIAIPDHFDSAANWPKCAKMISDIRDQSNCGCCWAFGSAEAASDRMCISTNGSIEIPLSADELCFCSNKDGCGGGYHADAWRYVMMAGLVSGSQQQPGDGKSDPYAGLGLCRSFSLPHCHHHGPTGSDPYPAEGATGCPKATSPTCPTKCDAGAKAPHNVFADDKYHFTGTVETFKNADALAEAVMTGGPVSVQFQVYDDFENYAGGIYKRTSGQQVGGHVVKIVGFGTDGGTKYWKVANSWNRYWGENGYFRIVRDCGGGCGNCGIEQNGVASSVDAQWVKRPSGPQVCPFNSCNGCAKYCGGNYNCGGSQCKCTSFGLSCTIPAPGPPAPSGDRFHCDTATKTCVKAASGHSTMDKCVAACA